MAGLLALVRCSVPELAADRSAAVTEQKRRRKRRYRRTVLLPRNLRLPLARESAAAVFSVLMTGICMC